ncbi:hypothetical protein PHLGIDRAFT_41927, partial [Phlebiopsis gigantea 11061_1 CR5-6]
SVSVQYPLEDQLPLIARINTFYNWTIANNTFISSHNNSLDYVALDLPGWLTFNRTTLSFYGTPASADEGCLTVKLVANDTKAEEIASSPFSLIVSSLPAPKLVHPVVEQFQLPNPSLSSVYLVSQHSSLRSAVPALRIPHKWSFSIGFQYDTFTSDSSSNLYYAALQADGSPLPDWISFNPRSITFNGVTPPATDTNKPSSLALALHASDQEGYSAAYLPFDLFVSEHELSLSTASLPTINVTANTEFSVSLNSPVDFSGVLLDGRPIQPSDIVAMEVDTSFYGDWLDYDTNSRTLSGTPPDSLKEDEMPVLPVTIATTVNQTIETNVSIAVVPSFFSTSNLQPVLVQAGQSLNFNLNQFFSNTSALDRQDMSLSAAFDPDNSTQFLAFDPNAATVTGIIPANFSDYSHITISFTAYSHVTHSTSHTVLPVSLTSSDYAHSHKKGPTNLSAATKAKLLLGLKIAFGVVGGLVFFGLCLAALRRCARVPDTAIQGEEGAAAWTEDEKKWYGIGIEVDGEGAGTPLQRVRTRMPDDPFASPASLRIATSPGVMRKADFLDKIRATARQVGDTVMAFGSTNTRKPRPVIGKPTLIMTEDGRRANADDLRLVSRVASDDPFDDMNVLRQYAPSANSGWTGASVSIPGSPSDSTAERSIPRRRADFAPPTNPSPSMLLATPPQTYSDGSSNSAKTHVTEAVVHRAERAKSVRSGRSMSVVSFQTQSQPDHGAPDGAARPRLVPFTSAARVPVPKMASTPFDAAQDRVIAGTPQGKTKRVTSQMAKVFRSVSVEKRFSQTEGQPGDDLSVGIEYVRALGGNAEHSLGKSAGPVPTPRMLARAGDPFKFRISTGLPLASTTPLEVRLVDSGKKPPRFLKVDLAALASAGAEKRVVEFSGVPALNDLGQWSVGVFVRGGDECVARVEIEVVE